MPNLKNILFLSIFFPLFLMACSKSDMNNECDKTKFACTPILSASEAIAEAAASEPIITKEEAIETANHSNDQTIDGDPDFYVSPEMPWSEQKKIINSSFKSLIKDEINAILNSNTDTWVIDVKSVKDGTGDQKGFVIYKYDVTSSSPDHDFLISAQTCTAKAQISSEDNRTPMAMTIDTNCYKNLEGFF